MEEKIYQLREIEATDIFAMVKIIRKIGIKGFAVALKEAKEGTKGYAILDMIIDRIPECEQEIYEFLSRLSGLKVKEIAKLKAATFMEMLYEVIESPSFVDFLKVALKRA